MSHAVHHDPTVPRGALIGAAILLLFVIALTGAVRFGFIPRAADPSVTRAAAQVMPAQERLLRFIDRTDGAVVVSDAVSGQIVAVVPFGQGGFLRATMRRMAKARISAGIGAEPPFKLIRWENGALSLSDPATGRDAEIYGFGPDHTKSFADMLKAPAS
ncbi:photosynthetic complex assembly protein PuhC [Sphingorhabdus sp.]|uniref:photosynthetic complex assembly protein PuhC n=1 Tax=Sphingorhabdus sp. TaxID=1902408 RepID=UPI003919EE4C